MALCINQLVSYLISFPLYDEGREGHAAQAPALRVGVDVLDLSPPPESSPTVGEETIFWLNWGISLVFCRLSLR
jgi:hypothetical protein